MLRYGGAWGLCCRGLGVRMCSAQPEVRVCFGLPELGRVCSQVSGACVCLGMAEPVGCVVGYRARVCLGMAEPVRCVYSRVSGARVLWYGGACWACSRVSVSVVSVLGYGGAWGACS